MSAPSTPVMSFAKLIAQRANAQRSTGPRTEAGKSRSRWNALRHGGWAGGRCGTDDAQRAIHEDPEDFQRLRESLRNSWGDPNDGIRNALIEDLAPLYWRRERMEHAWQILIIMQGTVSEYRAVMATTSQGGLPLLRQIEALDRAIDRKHRLLLRHREAAWRRPPDPDRAERPEPEVEAHPQQAAEETAPTPIAGPDVVANKKLGERTQEVVETTVTSGEGQVTGRNQEARSKKPEPPFATPQKANVEPAGTA